jgi:hypothetical protein
MRIPPKRKAAKNAAHAAHATCGQVVVEQAPDEAKRMRIWKSADWNRVQKAPTGIPKE